MRAGPKVTRAKAHPGILGLLQRLSIKELDMDTTGFQVADRLTANGLTQAALEQLAAQFRHLVSTEKGEIIALIEQIRGDPLDDALGTG